MPLAILVSPWLPTWPLVLVKLFILILGFPTFRFKKLHHFFRRFEHPLPNAGCIFIIIKHRNTVVTNRMWPYLFRHCRLQFEGFRTFIHYAVDFLPADIVKSRSRYIGCLHDLSALRFDRLLGHTTVLRRQSDVGAIGNCNLISRDLDISQDQLVRRLKA